jgi:hypothetical protein
MSLLPTPDADRVRAAIEARRLITEAEAKAARARIQQNLANARWATLGGEVEAARAA